jgi:stage IV sporulation protein B
MKFKKFFLMLLISLLIIPTNILAYSNKLIVGGSNIGIEVKTKGILVIGQYKINNELVSSSSGLKAGDYIIKVNGNDITSISDFTKEINNDDDKVSIDIEYLRDDKTYDSSLKLVEQNGELKTGLYVKDSISGIGTLTYIDPETRKFGALGHEIQDKNTNELLNIDSGIIFYSNITGITKSLDGNPGEKEASYDINKVYGSIEKNTINGIFGTYNGTLDDSVLYEVAKKEDVKTGLAQILTVTEGETISSYTINIESLNTKDETKNIVFSITDKELLSKTGGIVQGMSGSPIIQDGKIIGAVTHVIVNDCTKGYGTFITNMLEEAEN